jgi:uncharacterized protein (DUF885 family)
VTAATQAVQQHVAGAYACLVAPLEEALAVVNADGYVDHAGVGALPSGGAYYAWKLREQTSTRLSPEEIHALGHAEVARIMGEMRETIARLAAAGDTELDPSASVPANMTRLAQSSKWVYADSPEGKAKCVADFEALVPKMDALLAGSFDVAPKQPLKIVPVPPHMEEGSPAAFYMPPSLDGSRDGVFYCNLGDMSAQYKYGVRACAARPLSHRATSPHSPRRQRRHDTQITAARVRSPRADAHAVRTRGHPRPPLSARDPIRDEGAALLPQGGRGLQRLL